MLRVNDKVIDLSAVVSREGGGRRHVPILRDTDCHFTLLLIFTLRQTAQHRSSHQQDQRKKKNTSVPLGPDTAAGRRTDRHIVRREGREKRKSQAYKSGWKDTVSHWFACLCVSLCAWISEYISVWSAPGDHCQSCNDTSGGKLVHEAINIQKHSTFWFISRRGCSSKQEGVRGRWHRNR